MLDIDVQVGIHLIREITHNPRMALALNASCLVAMGAIALWIAFAMVINPLVGRPLLRLGGPMLLPAQRESS